MEVVVAGAVAAAGMATAAAAPVGCWEAAGVRGRQVVVAAGTGKMRQEMHPGAACVDPGE